MDSEKYYYDVIYDTWMLCKNPDNVNRDITDDYFNKDIESIDCARDNKQERISDEMVR